MAHARGAVSQDLVGRATELAHLGAMLEGTSSGTPFTLVVSGEAGVGKTALVQHAGASAAPQMCILFGASLPLSRMVVPFLALRSAITQAPRFEGISRPSFGSDPGAGSNIILAIDDWLTQLCQIRPVALVIDDLQWADQNTLDVLMYLIAGPVNRRLAIVATLRSSELSDSHPLQRWLADIGRMPRTSRLRLGPLDVQGTGAQLAQVLGAPPHQSLVHDVFGHSAGNAYLNRLLVLGVAPEARHLPELLPEDLTAAVLRSWHGLSDAARQLTALMAVGGRPIRGADLCKLAEAAGTPGDASTILHEVMEAGITECAADGIHWWFRHPLIAEVLEQRMDAEQRRHWHALFAAYGDDVLASGSAANFELLAAVAQHHDAAGHNERAYQLILCACASEKGAGGRPETLHLLHRAIELQAGLPAAVQSREELLVLLRTAAEGSGAMDVELEAIDALLLEVDEDQRPLDVAELLVRRALLRFSAGEQFLSVDQLLPALRLAEVSPESWQCAYVLAELAHVQMWNGDPEASKNAARALKIALQAGNPRALSYALTANSMVALLGEHPEEARALAARAADAAERARDFWALIHATVWRANATEAWSSVDFADLMRAGRERLSALGAPHVYISKMAADEASSYLAIGQWTKCSKALRIALGIDPGPLGDVAARLTAARLAALQGTVGEAQSHLARAEELVAHESGYNNLEFDAVRAEVLLAVGNPSAAYAAAMAGANKAGRLPTMCEWLLPLAARALADMIQMTHDEGVDTAKLLKLTEELVQRSPSAFQEIGNNTELYEAQVSGFNLLYQAEVGRARSNAQNATQWIASANACGRAQLPWEEAYSYWRAVQALLLHRHNGHGQAAALLRKGLELAQDLQAQPLLAALQETALRARIPLEQSDMERRAGVNNKQPNLTTRELEVLDYVVAGRTYGEIARALFISEKTVGSHISNMLRKTGTANRLDLSRFVTRADTGSTDRSSPGV